MEKYMGTPEGQRPTLQKTKSPTSSRNTSCDKKRVVGTCAAVACADSFQRLSYSRRDEGRKLIPKRE